MRFYWAMKIILLLFTLQFPLLAFCNTCSPVDQQNKYSALNRGDRLAALGARSEALKCYQAACSMGHESTCESLKEYKKTKNFAQIFGPDENTELQKCMLDQRVPGCQKLIEGLADADMKKAIYKSNCENQRPGSCFQLAAIYFKSNELIKAQQYYTESCNQGEQLGCSMSSNLGQMVNGERMKEQIRVAEKQIEEDNERERRRILQDTLTKWQEYNESQKPLKCTSIKDSDGILQTNCIK